MKRSKSSTVRASVAFGLMALSWLFLIPIYERPVPWLGWTLVGAALLLLLPGSVPEAERASSGRNRLLVLVAALLVGLLLPAPYAAGFLMLLAGVVGARVLPRTGAALQSGGAAFLLQGLCVVAYELVCSAGGKLALGGVLAPVLSTLFGVEASSSGGALYVGSPDLQLVAITPDSLGLLVPLLIAVPTWAIARGALSARTLGVIAAYTLLRYAVVVAWCAEHPEHYAGALGPLAVAASFVPLLALVWALDRGLPATRPAGRLRPGWYGAAAISAAAASYGIVGVDPGVDKAGRILVDDAHGAWESGTAERSMSNFGTDSTYTYSALWDWLQGRYPLEIHREGDLTAESLKHVDVLVLKTPSRAYSPQERELIEGFVARGGGLLAIGDHTDVFGTTTVLNAVIDPLGLRIEPNVGLLIHKRFVGDYRFRKDRFFANPLSYGIDAFDFMGPASVLVTEGAADHVLQCQAQVLEEVDYRDTSFFGDRIVDLDDVVRPFHACVAKRYGRGRLVVWGDSTVFSNFSMFEIGKPEMILNMLSYLNKENTDPGARKAAVKALGLVALLGLLAAYARRRTPEALTSIVAGAAGGLVIVALHGDRVMEASYREPAMDPGMTIVGYDVAHGAMGEDVPPGDGLSVEQVSRTDAYDSLFQAAMRIQRCFPRAVQDYEDLDDLDVLFLVDPTPLAARESAALRQAMERGLRVVVAVSGVDSTAGVARLLEPHGMSVKVFADPSQALRAAEILPTQIAAVDTGLLAPVDAALSLVGWEKELHGASSPLAYGATVLGVAGGAPVWTAGRRSVPVLAKSNVGRGWIFGFASGALFRSEEMGQSSSVILPQDPQMASYRAFEALLAEVLGRGGDASAPDVAHDPHGAGHADHAHEEGEHGGDHGHGDGAHGAPHGSHGLAGGALARQAGARAPRPHAEADADQAEIAQVPLPPAGEVVRARISVFLKNASQAAFGAGYVLESDSGDGLRFALDPGTGALDPHAPSAVMLVTPKALALAGRGAKPVASRRPEAESISMLLGLPESWSGEGWAESVVDDDPWHLVSRGLRRNGLEELGNDLIAGDEDSGTLPAEGWNPLEADASYRVLRSPGVIPLGGEILGKAEVWIGATTGRPRKLALSFRMAGQVSDVDWYDVVILYDDYQSHSGFPVDLDPETILRGDESRWFDLNDDLVARETTR